MDETITSDEPSGKKLVAVAGDIASRSQNNPAGLDESASTSELVHRPINSERSPLIRPRRSTDELSEDTSSQGSDSGLPRVQYGSIPLRRAPPVERKSRLALADQIKELLSRPANSVMSLILIVIIGLVLVFAANLKTDNKGIQIKPQHVLIYLMLLIFVVILWTSLVVIPQKLHYSSHHEGTLFPRHLLTGIAIFGTVSATTQVLLLLDFIKCSRYVDGLSYVYAVYPIFKIAFIYFQIYFFYKLSRDGIRHVSLYGGTFFVMVTLATNLCIWVSVFFNDASADPKLKNVTWLNHYYFGVEKEDRCANENFTSEAAQQLHELVWNLSPYIGTFSMEYALLASGLLLHIWMVIKSPVPKVPKSKKQPWTLWRGGFILGLMSMPVVFMAYMKEQTMLQFTAPKVTLYVLKACFFIVLLFLCWFCINQINEKSGFIKKKKPMKLEVVLLGVSAFLGFPAFDLACIFAAICEWENFPGLELAWYGICPMCELLAVCFQFYFIKKAYQFKVPEIAGSKVKKVARFIRQYASFALVINIAYWASKTFELRRTTSDHSIAEQFFGKYTWFSLSHFALPVCIFFYFHLAICYANVISSFSQFGPLWAFVRE